MWAEEFLHTWIESMTNYSTRHVLNHTIRAQHSIAMKHYKPGQAKGHYEPIVMYMYALIASSLLH